MQHGFSLLTRHFERCKAAEGFRTRSLVCTQDGGFSLVELSIVPGLLMGGILTSQSLIREA